MPPAVALAVPAVIGAGSAASGGKKGQSAAQKQAQAQFQLQQQLMNKGLSAWQPAADYWQAILSGDPTKASAAVGPYADIIKGQGEATSQQMAATLPMGGEATAAQAANQRDVYNQVARLYAGVQPTAAGALEQLAGLPMQLGAPNVGAGLKAQQNLASQNIGKAGQIGQGLGSKVAGARNQPKSSWGQVFGKRSPSAPAPSTTGGGSSKFPGA